MTGDCLNLVRLPTKNLIDYKKGDFNSDSKIIILHEKGSSRKLFLLGRSKLVKRETR